MRTPSTKIFMGGAFETRVFSRCFGLRSLRRAHENFVRHHSSRCHRKNSGLSGPPIQTAADSPRRPGSRPGILPQLIDPYCRTLAVRAKPCPFRFFFPHFLIEWARFPFLDPFFLARNCYQTISNRAIAVNRGYFPAHPDYPLRRWDWLRKFFESY